MKLKWLGHACFLLTTDQGVKIVTDPYDPKVGYNLPSLTADIVTISHNHYDHNYVGAIRGHALQLHKPGTYARSGVQITAVSTWHDDLGGAKRGSNLAFVFEADGIRLCHLGDLGHMPTVEQKAALGPIDVLLIPIDGVYTMDEKLAAAVVSFLGPKLVIPMHYKTKVSKVNLAGVEPFLAAMGGGERADRSELDLSPDQLPPAPKVLVLSYE